MIITVEIIIIISNNNINYFIKHYNYRKYIIYIYILNNLAMSLFAFCMMSQ